MRTTIQIPVIILPTVSPLGTETEAIGDVLEHTSLELQTEVGGSIIRNFERKSVIIVATEVVVAGVPGALNCWIEVSPYPSSVSTVHWTMLGVPVIIAGTGVNGALHNLVLPWDTYSPFFRLVVQTPALVATAGWAVQAMFCGQG